MKRLLLLTTLLCSVMLSAKEYELLSPDGKISVHIASGERLLWSVTRGNEVLIAPSEASLRLLDGTVYGSGSKFLKSLRRSVNQVVKAQNFKRSEVHDSFNELILVAKDFDLVFRAYDDGVAYRFVTKRPVTVESETAQFSFAEDHRVWAPYVKEQGSFEGQFFNSFENIYADMKISEWDPERLAFMPLTVRTDDGIAMCITEADLLNYPGMYLHNGNASTNLKGVFAPVPDAIEQGGHNMLQGLVKTRKTFIYQGTCAESLPWRIVAVVDNEYELADNDLVYRLSKPAEGDFSWVRPGKVAWDWWNDWNVYGVDFRAGINNETYKYYIDFASENGIEYVILDEGWAVNLKADLFEVVPEIDLPMLCSYARSRNVGLVLWAGYWAFNRDMDEICRHYSEMGIAGWKIDFMDRDDQDMVAFYEKAARTAAKYHQIVDFHGAFKPAGLTWTWPNVLNFEGVAGLEQVKWAPDDYDMVKYDVTIPFTRLVAGPADYTQGAMRNACKGNFKAVWSEPMSQGTRCRQLAQYVIYDAPFTMLCDSPSNYMKEKECTGFISEVPTVWDETVALDGRIGEYVLMARRSGDRWYIAGLTDWNAREVTIDLTQFASGSKGGTMILWKDGINADRAACDYKKVQMQIQDSITVRMAPGGGFVIVIGDDLCHESIGALIDRVADVSMGQCLQMESRLTEDTMPRSVKNGDFWASGLEWWCSGFYPGTCWYTYLLSGDERVKDLAIRQTHKLSDLSKVYFNHDIGFQIMCSYGMEYKITGNEKCLPVIKEAAGLLASRFNEAAGVTSSWDNDSTCRTIIDNMMNLELLTWAARKFNNPEWERMAISHANTTMKNHFRDDYTSYHVLDYDPQTGRVLDKKTAQGYSDESEWSRGQSWGLYGYTMMYRETGCEEYLQQAVGIADYLLTRLAEDPVPNWDFDAPAEMTQKDASAGAIMAAGYAELCSLVKDEKKASIYHEMAEDIVRALASEQYLARKGENFNFLLMHSTGSYLKGGEVDAPLTYADYYFLEAVFRLKSLK